MLNKLVDDTFFKHPKEHNMTYFQHLTRAWYYGFRSLLCFIFLFIHGLFPILFETNGSDMIKKMADELSDKKLY